MVYFFEKSITGPYCTECFTIADLAMWRLLGWFSEGTLDQVPLDILDSYPKLKVLYRTVGSKPRIQDWMKQYRKRIVTQILYTQKHVFLLGFFEPSTRFPPSFSLEQWFVPNPSKYFLRLHQVQDRPFFPLC